MASIISAGTTDATSLNVSSDKTGILQLASNNAVTAVTIDTSQNVGIGTTSPTGKFQINQGTQTYAQVILANSSTDNATVRFVNAAFTAEQATIQALTGGNLAFTTGANTNERMRIDSSGNLLVGVTSPSGGFNTIAATGSNWALVAKNLSTSGSVYGFKSLLSYAPNNTSSYFIGCEDNGTGRMYVYSNGNVVNTNNSYGAISDRTLKENIVDASPKLENLCKVKIRNFNLIGETTKQLGVVAQELEEIFPSMVEVDGNTQKKQVKYSVFVPMLVKAIQELKAINDTQAETINALTARVVALEGQ